MTTLGPLGVLTVIGASVDRWCSLCSVRVPQIFEVHIDSAGSQKLVGQAARQAQSFGSWLGAATGVASGDVLFLVLASWVAGGGAKAGVFPLTIWSAGAMLAGVTMVVVHTMATRHVTPAATRALRFLCAVIPFVVAGTEMCHAVGGELVHRPPLPLAAPSWVNSMSPAGALGCGNAAQLADMAELSAGYCHQGTGGFSKVILRPW